MKNTILCIFILTTLSIITCRPRTNEDVRTGKLGSESEHSQCLKLVSSFPEGKQDEVTSLCNQMNLVLNGRTYNDLDASGKQEYERLRNQLTNMMLEKKRKVTQDSNLNAGMSQCERFVMTLPSSRQANAQVVCTQMDNLLNEGNYYNLDASGKKEYVRLRNSLKDMIPAEPEFGEDIPDKEKPGNREELNECEEMVDDMRDNDQRKGRGLCKQIESILAGGKYSELSEDNKKEYNRIMDRLRDMIPEEDETMTDEEMRERFEMIISNLPDAQKVKARQLHFQLSELKNKTSLTEEESRQRDLYREELGEILASLYSNLKPDSEDEDSIERMTEEELNARFERIIANLPEGRQNRARELRTRLEELKDKRELSDTEKESQKSYREELGDILGQIYVNSESLQ